MNHMPQPVAALITAANSGDTVTLQLTLAGALTAPDVINIAAGIFGESIG